MTKTVGRAALLTATLAVLAACGTTPAPVAPVAPAVAPERHDYALTVAAGPADTAETLEARYGAAVIALDAEAGYAILGLSEGAAAAMRGSRIGALSTAAARLEPNKNVFSGGGISAWSGGLSAWSGGLSAWSGGLSAWSGGTYSPVPENTGAWTRIGLAQAQSQYAKNLGAGVTVAVIDTGVDLSHPAFVGSLADAALMRDWVDGDAVPQEAPGTAYGHGTSVAGIVLQVAPKARILPLRVLGPNGEGDVVNVAAAIDHAVAKGAKVVNLSLGSTAKSTTVQDAIKRATAKAVYVVSSAGNDNAGTITYPAAEAVLGSAGDYSLSVGSVDALDRKSSFSNYSTALEMVGPGEKVYGPYPGGQRAYWSGTSMAAPMAAGALALARGQTLSVPAHDLTKNLAEKAHDVYNSGRNEAFKNKLGKKGRLDLVEFLKNVVKQ